MHRTRAIVAVILVGAGLVWIGQGTGLLKGNSFMVGDMRWALIGTVCVVAGLAVGWLEVRQRRA
jgi:VIT1/CCC1 family predicted Fe2+/Mn2+ transporter